MRYAPKRAAKPTVSGEGYLLEEDPKNSRVESPYPLGR